MILFDWHHTRTKKFLVDCFYTCFRKADFSQESMELFKCDWCLTIIFFYKSWKKIKNSLENKQKVLSTGKEKKRVPNFQARGTPSNIIQATTMLYQEMVVAKWTKTELEHKFKIKIKIHLLKFTQWSWNNSSLYFGWQKFHLRWIMTIWKQVSLWPRFWLFCASFQHTLYKLLSDTESFASKCEHQTAKHVLL